MQCRACKKEIPDGSTFCNICGANQSGPDYCVQCGTEIPSDSTVCPKCGFSLNTDIKTEIFTDPETGRVEIHMGDYRVYGYVEKDKER